MRILVLVSLFSILLDVGFGRLDLSKSVGFTAHMVKNLEKYEKQAGCWPGFFMGDDDGVCFSLWWVHATYKLRHH